MLEFFFSTFKLAVLAPLETFKKEH